MTRLVSAISACLLTAVASAAAQTNRTTILMGPAPNKTLRLRATEIIETTIDADPARPPTLALERRERQVTVTMDLTSTAEFDQLRWRRSDRAHHEQR